MSFETQPPEQVPQRLPERIDVGRIVETSLSALQLKLADLLVLAVFFLLIPTVLLGFAPPYPDPQFVFWYFLTAIPALVFDGAGSLILYGALGGGAGPTPTEAIRAAALRLSELFIIVIVGGMVIGAGLVLLAVPGLFLTVCWLVATPVLMIEKTSFIDALRRSAALSRGSRWRLLGLVALLAAAVIGAMVLLWSLMSIAILSSSQDIALRLGVFVLGPVVGVGVRMITIAVVTAAYAELRRVQGAGVAPAKVLNKATGSWG
jgi:hypothetical protein